jgi:SWI/SNF-related matrix-associated actin-dependent regulator of chromatin subfamily A member 5
LTGTPL